MTIEQITQAMGPLVAEWPVSTMVWCRITGKKGMIVGYQVIAPLVATIRVDYGDGGLHSELPMCLQTTKPRGDDDEGEEWKDTEETKR